MHALFLTTRVDRPSHRFRVEQLLPCWTAAGHTFEICVLPRSSLVRMWDYRRWSRYDLVFVQQRTFSSLELGWLRKNVKRLVFDVDDAVMFKPDGSADPRRQQRFAAMVHSADVVICGNRYLAEQSAPHNSQVTIIPTAVDTDRFHPRLRVAPDDSNRALTIGWTGSRSTAPYLNPLMPVIGQLPADQVCVKLIADKLDGLDLSPLGNVPCEFVKWTSANEIPETATFDIGLMPLPDTPFTRGKCGCKALQYMALGIPAIVSPVGVNREIIEHGVNGLFATTPNEWRTAFEQLLSDPALRQRLAAAGRKTVEASFSLATQGRRVVQLLAG